MFRKDKWPFRPDSLGEIFEQDTLAVIESGCCERVQRALTLLDYDPKTDTYKRIDSINPRQQFEEFCKVLRDDALMPGGNAVCKKNDLDEAKRSLEAYRNSGNPFRMFSCHMGLIDCSHVIQVCGQPVAILFTGQHKPAEGLHNIENQIKQLENSEHRGLKADEATRDQLLLLAQKLLLTPTNLRERIEREVRHIERIAEAEYQRKKHEWEQEFLASLLAYTFDKRGNTAIDHVRENVRDLLHAICTFCRCQYAIFFANLNEGDTVLPPLAAYGKLPRTEKDLPHFNWKKAGFNVENFNIQKWDIRQSAEIANRGIRGDSSSLLAAVACVLPVSPVPWHRGVLVLGPFAEKVDLGNELTFLTRISDIVAFYVFMELQLRHLERERQHWQSTARILMHQIGTALTPIVNQISKAKDLTQKMDGNHSYLVRILDLLQRAEDLGFQLDRSAKETLTSHIVHGRSRILQVERDDLKLEIYPLSVLIANCVESFAVEFGQKQRHLLLDEDKSIEALPSAEVDVARMTIVLSNLLHNALKYSYENTRVYVRARRNVLEDPENPTATIEIDDLGYEIRPEDRERIFEEGTRALTKAKMHHIPGTGFGLWEARAVIEAHGGKISVSCDETSIHRSEGTGYRVVFSIVIPLKQNQKS